MMGTIGANGQTTNKGLGLPRVELQFADKLEMGKTAVDLTAKGDTHIGLLVYHVMSDDDICKRLTSGIYVWTGKKWTGISTPQKKSVSTDKYKGANSYIVKPNSSVKIPIDRAQQIWRDYQSPSGVPNAATGQVLDYNSRNWQDNVYAEIAWEEGFDGSTNLVRSGVLKAVPHGGNPFQGEMLVETGANIGNALITLKLVNTNLPIWQWHIWVTNEAPDQQETWESATTKQCNYFMDRNLGALIAGGPSYTTTGTSDMKRLSHGLYYQWGRPTPILTHGVNLPANLIISNTNDPSTNLTIAIT